MTKKKWLDLGIFGIALFLFFAVKSGFVFLWDTFSLPTPGFFDTLPVALPAVVAFALVLPAVIFARRHPVVQAFGEEVVGELGKVTWPERKETVLSTGVVLAMLGIACLILLAIDSLWGTLTRGILEF